MSQWQEGAAYQARAPVSDSAPPANPRPTEPSPAASALQVVCLSGLLMRGRCRAQQRGGGYLQFILFSALPFPLPLGNLLRHLPVDFLLLLDGLHPKPRHALLLLGRKTLSRGDHR